ncbi:MlaD family protein [bacterium]|nr:MlaD family protein [bacterium]
MAGTGSNFKVGLFVVGGTLIMAAALIWLGATKFFSETTTFVTYFDESVQGLDTGSQVKFMGVAVGTVSRIRVGPDGKLIEVQMELESPFRKEDDMRAELAMAGITGMKFVEITRSPASEPIEIKFNPRGTYIPAKASGTAEIFEALENVYESVMQIDFKGISDNVKTSFHTISERVDDPNIDRLVEAMADAGERLRYLLNKKQTENAIDEIDRTLAELKGLVGAIRAEVEGADVKGTFADMRMSIQSFAQLFERLDNELAASLINLRRTTDNLARMTEKMARDPAQMILGEPPPERIVAPEPTGREMAP